MCSWKSLLLEYAKSHDLESHDTAMGIGIGFTDGCDVFWVLPGEVFSTVPCNADGPGPERNLIAEYEAIDKVRSQVIHALRHHLAENHIQVDRETSGDWAWESTGGVSSSVNVGACLTAQAQNNEDIRDTLIALLKGSFLAKAPSPKRLARYLSMPLPPANEAPIDIDDDDDDDDQDDDDPETINQAVTQMVVCGALQHPEPLDELKRIKDKTKPTGRIEQVLRKLDDLLPGCKAACDLLKPGQLQLDYTDGHDSYSVDTRSRSLVQDARELGIEGAAQSIAQKYRHLDQLRADVFNAIWAAANQRGWYQDPMHGLGILGVEAVIRLGATQQEVKFEPGEKLSRTLESSTPEEALRTLFQDNPDFAQACVTHQTQEPGVPVTPPPEKPLIPAEPSTPSDQIELAELNPKRLQDFDAFAAEQLASFLKQKNVSHYYQDRDVYDPAIDTWCSQKDWLAIAERGLDDKYVDPIAIKIFLDADDPRADKMARRYLKNCSPHHEIDPIEVDIIWRYRHEFPKLAREWFVNEYEDVFAEERAALNDPVAMRYLAHSSQTIDDEDGAMSPSRARSLPQDQQESLRLLTVHWASTEHRCSPLDATRLRLALELHWPEVAAALSKNPRLLPGLLTIDRRVDQFDEPGMLLAKDLILIWSRLLPDRFLASLLITARETDLVGLAEEASRRSAVGRPEIAKNLKSSFTIYRQWMKDLEPALAIAWTRCRPHLGK